MNKKSNLLYILGSFITCVIIVSCQFNPQRSGNEKVNNLATELVTLPTARYFHTLSYDTEREVIVLFGGYGKDNILGDTWEYKNGIWVQIHPPQSPPARRDHAMVYNTERNTIMIFGGATDVDEFFYVNDFWEYDGNSWIQLNTQAIAPSPRKGMSMIYAHSQIILHGGAGPLWDFWQFDSQEWHELVIQSPIMGGEAAFTELVYDSDRDVIILFGHTGDTYEFNDQEWQETATLDPDTLISVYDIKLIYDTHRKLVVLTGVNPNEDELNTWEYDGTKWTRASPDKSPPARTGYAMAFDEYQGITVIFGGLLLQNNDHTGAILNDTWEYDGVTWTQR